MLNTTRQVGSVIGTAAVGALLQNRLVASLTSQASIRSAGLPAPVRDHFVSGIRQSAASGVSPAARRAPPRGARRESRRRSRRSCAVAAEVFTHGYVIAMRQTMLMPIAVVLLAAASCSAIKNKRPDLVAAAGEQAGQMAGTISSPGSSGSLGNSPGSSPGPAS